MWHNEAGGKWQLPGGGGSGLQGNEKFVDLRFLKICKLFIQILFHLKLQKFVVGDFYVCFFFVFKFFFFSLIRIMFKY